MFWHCEYFRLILDIACPTQKSAIPPKNPVCFFFIEMDNFFNVMFSEFKDTQCRR